MSKWSTGRPAGGTRERRSATGRRGMRREAGRVHQPPELLNRVLLLQRGHVPCTCGMLIRRRALEVTGGFEESFHLYEDQTLWVKLLLRFPVYVTDVVGAGTASMKSRLQRMLSDLGCTTTGGRTSRAPPSWPGWTAHARSSGLADASVQRALRLASARYGDSRATLTRTERLTLARYKLGKRVRSSLRGVLRRMHGTRRQSS